MDDLRFCPQGCCRFINNRAVNKNEYDEVVGRAPFGPPIVEALIPCRHIPAGHHQKNVEGATGFYLGAPMKRTFGTLLPTGTNAIVFDVATGERLREATVEDIKKWNDAGRSQIEAAKGKKN